MRWRNSSCGRGLDDASKTVDRTATTYLFYTWQLMGVKIIMRRRKSVVSAYFYSQLLNYYLFFFLTLYFHHPHLYPPSPQYILPSISPYNKANVGPRDDRHRPLLPFSIPIQRYRHRSNPRAQNAAYAPSPNGIKRQDDTQHLSPYFGVDAMNKE